MATSIPLQSTSGFSLRSLCRKKWRIAQRLYRDDGILTLLVEVLCQISKPAVWTYDSLRLRVYRALGRETVSVFGNRIAVIPKDPGISRELALYRVHEPLETRLLMRTLKPGMNVVDIGGNIGYYALLEARMVGAAGKVIAIEPMPRNFEQLCKNVELNGYGQIATHNFAIGDQDGAASMYLAGKSNHHSLQPNPAPRGVIQVSVRTLDSVLETYDLPRVDLVRMDLEGYEIVVINGMRQTIEKYSPRLLVELHPDLLGKGAMVNYLQVLADLGYRVEWLFEQERDMPLRWRFLRIERPEMNDLMKDSRICTDPRAMTALFRRDCSQRDSTGEA